MRILEIKKGDRPQLEATLKAQEHFRTAEVQIALELIDIVLTQPSQEDYILRCLETNPREVVGFVCFGQAPLTDAVYDLYWIVVHPTSWNQGVGTCLLQHAEKELKRRRGRLLLIETSSLPGYRNPRAFYRKHGYRQRARIQDYYALGDHKLVFGKSFSFPKTL